MDPGLTLFGFHRYPPSFGPSSLWAGALCAVSLPNGLGQHRTIAAAGCVVASFASFVSPFRGRKLSRSAAPPFPAKPHCAAVSSFAALRMRHTLCGYVVGLWRGPQGSFTPQIRCENLEIHKVFRRFRNKFVMQNSSPNLLAELCGIAIETLLPGRYCVLRRG